MPTLMNARASFASRCASVLTLALIIATPGHAWATPATGTRGIVATAHPAGSEAALAMLKAGGNAVDAAVAAAFVLAVVEPYSSGIGGGGFALVKMNETVDFMDFREVAPKAATRDMYVKDGKPDPMLSRDGILSVGVPGAVAGYLGLHERFGVLPRAQVLEPAIKTAADGFVVDPNYLADTEWRLEVLQRDPEAARIFLTPGAGANEPARLPPLGHRIVQPELANTLRALAAEGAKAFYRGELAKRLVADMKTRGGLITAEDLAGYKTRARTPLVGSFRGHAVVSSPPPSAGGQVVLTVLNALESLPTPRPWRDPRELHLMIETMKRAFADRALLGDSDFVPDPTRVLTARARTPKLLRLFAGRATPAARVPPGQATELEPKGRKRSTAAQPESKSTTHLSVLDAAGNAVAMTTTVNYGFGSGVVARGTGVLWNDQMDDFAVAPGVANAYGIAGSEANAVAAGKVPLSSMAPTLVFEAGTPTGPLRMVVGSPGGPRIPTTVIQVIVNHLDHGADIEQAIAEGRIHHQHLPDTVFVEPRSIDQLTRRELERRGHKLELDGPWSNAMAIAIDPKTGIRTGAADPRGVGVALAE